MKYSRAARHIINGMAQASVAAGLASVAFTSFVSASCGKWVVGGMLLPKMVMSSPPPLLCHVVEGGGQGTGPRGSSMQKNDHARGQGGFVGRGSGLLLQPQLRVRRFVKLLMHRLQYDAAFKRKWKGVLAMVILCWFRGLRTRSGRGRGRGRGHGHRYKM